MASSMMTINDNSSVSLENFLDQKDAIDIISKYLIAGEEVPDAFYTKIASAIINDVEEDNVKFILNDLYKSLMDKVVVTPFPKNDKYKENIIIAGGCVADFFRGINYDSSSKKINVKDVDIFLRNTASYSMGSSITHPSCTDILQHLLKNEEQLTVKSIPFHSIESLLKEKDRPYYFFDSRDDVFFSRPYKPGLSQKEELLAQYFGAKSRDSTEAMKMITSNSITFHTPIESISLGRHNRAPAIPYNFVWKKGLIIPKQCQLTDVVEKFDFLHTMLSYTGHNNKLHGNIFSFLAAKFKILVAKPKSMGGEPPEMQPYRVAKFIKRGYDTSILFAQIPALKEIMENIPLPYHEYDEDDINGPNMASS